MKPLSKRIKDGIKFFQIYKNKYESEPFKKYWPEFLLIVSEYVEGAEEFFKDGKKDLVSEAKGIFEAKEVEK